MSDFNSGHSLVVHELEPRVGLTAQSLEPASDSVSPSVSTPPPLILCLALCLSQIFLNIYFYQWLKQIYFKKVPWIYPEAVNL